jgi:hypothetical protein
MKGKKMEQKPKKMHSFLNFMKKYPVVISLTIAIPFTAAFFSYMASDYDFHYNIEYHGEEINADAENFELTGIKKVADVMQMSTGFSYQGGACYENYYAICCHGFESIIIYDANTMKVAHTVNTGIIDNYWHCNQIFFGHNFYSSRDKFPLLYVSMENKEVLSTMVFRIYKQGDAYYTTRIQTIRLDFSDEKDTIYYPNSYFDYDEEIIYYAGYTEDSYMRSDSNKLKYYAFDLPDYRYEDAILETSDANKTFVLPSETATQGGFISEGYLYQTFSFGDKVDPLRMPKMRIVDLDKEKIVKDFDLGPLLGVYEEFEHVAIARNGKLLTLGNPYHIYELEYKKRD